MKKKRAKAKKKSGLFSLRYLLPAGFFLALSVFLLLGLNRNPNEIPSPLIGKAAPEYALPRLADAPASIGRRALAPGRPAQMPVLVLVPTPRGAMTIW